MLNKKRHILFITSWYKTPEAPVFGAFFEDQARALQRAGHSVGVIYPEYIPPSEFLSTVNNVLHDFYMDKGIPTFYIKAFSGVPKMRRLNYLRFSKAVNGVFLKYQETFGTPDVIHAHSAFHAGIAGRYISRKNKIPFVITEYLTSFHMGLINAPTDIDACRRVYETADAALIISEYFKKELEKGLGINTNTFKVIPHLVNRMFTDDLQLKKHHPGETFKFFTSSLLFPRKNVKLILDAMKILIDRNINVHLTIGGEGPEEEHLRNHVTRIGIAEHVRFGGTLTRPEVKTELDNCHAFVLASTYETFGVVLIESLACGRPVVLTNSGGPNEFIRPEHGIIVNNHEPQELALAMEHMINNYSNYNQNDIREYCINNFSEAKIVEELSHVYSSAIQHTVITKLLST